MSHFFEFDELNFEHIQEFETETTGIPAARAFCAFADIDAVSPATSISHDFVTLSRAVIP